jgi:hypothetical protein
MGAGDAADGAIGLSHAQQGGRGRELDWIANWRGRTHGDVSSRSMLASKPFMAKGRTARGACPDRAPVRGLRPPGRRACAPISRDRPRTRHWTLAAGAPARSLDSDTSRGSK